MDITFVATKLDLDGGGSNHSLRLMARLLTDRGYNVSVLTIMPGKNTLSETPEFDIIQPPERKYGTRLGVLERAYRAMTERADQTDIFHVFAPSLLPAAGYFRERNATPVFGRLNTYTQFCVNTDQMDGECYKNCTVRKKFHHQDASLPKRVAKLPFYGVRTFIEPELATKLDGYFALSPAVAQIYADRGVPRDRITVAPNFYNPDFADSSTTSDSNDDFIALYVGRMKESKGIDVLLNALAQTNTITARLIGDGDATDTFRSLASDLGLTDRVSFEGWVDNEDLPRYYRDADVFVHPGRWPEPFGRTLLETMQCGTPAIVSDIGGPPWVVGDAGRTFSPGDAEALAATLQELYTAPSQLSGLQAECSPQLERFRPETVLSKIETEYRAVADLGS